MSANMSKKQGEEKKALRRISTAWHCAMWSVPIFNPNELTVN
jgi:hypothetical protein